MTTWDDLNARARGLGTHLLRRSELEAMARAPDLPTLAGELARRGYPVGEILTVSGAGLELAARRAIAARLATLIRWAGRRAPTLSVLFEDEDRRSIAALLRGAVQRAPAELRLSGLIPTPELPERALEELARQPSAAGVASLLLAWRHPLAKGLLPEAGRPEPDLLRLEHTLNLDFARRAVRSARRAGRRGLLLRHVRTVIDVENGFTALILADEAEARIGELWIPDGGGLALDLARRAVATRDPVMASTILTAGFAGSRLAPVFAKPEANPAGLEAAVLAALIATYEAAARTEPLSVAPLLAFAMRLRAEALDVRRLIWGTSLGAPQRVLVEGLVTAR